MTEKICISCGVLKAEDAFSPRGRSGARRNQCRVCREAGVKKSQHAEQLARLHREPEPVVYPAWRGPVCPGALAWRV